MNVHDYPRAIQAAALELGRINDELAALRDQMRLAEMVATDSVISAVAEGTGKPLYTNDKAREVAIFNALAASKAYRAMRERERRLERDRATFTAQLERLRREYQLAAIDYEVERLGRRDAA